MFRHLTDVLTSWGPAGILLLSILDSSGVPVAGVFDALLILIAAKNPSAAWLCAALAVAGSVTGNIILFSAARRGSGRFADNIPPTGRAARFREWFKRYGMITVFIPAMLPIPLPLKLFVVSAGVLGTSATEFILVVLAARFLRYFGEAWLGVRLGLESADFLKDHAWHLLASAAILATVLAAFVHWRGRSRAMA